MAPVGELASQLKENNRWLKGGAPITRTGKLAQSLRLPLVNQLVAAYLVYYGPQCHSHLSFVQLVILTQTREFEADEAPVAFAAAGPP